MTDEQLIQFLKGEGYYNIRKVPGVGFCALENMIFTVALWIDLNEYGRDGRYCFPNRLAATKALQEWDGKGDPGNEWSKYKGHAISRSNPEKQEQ